MIGQVCSNNGKKYNIIILAGGAGSRMGEVSDYIPKALSKLGNSRSIDFIIHRYLNVAHKFIIGTGWHADLLTSYLKGNYSRLDIEFSYEKPEDIVNNGISTLYCLDHCDSRYPTIILFCDLILLSNFFINRDNILFLASINTQGNVGTFRHLFDKNTNSILQMTSPVCITESNYGLMGNFILSDTPVLKSCAYSNYSKMNDLTDDIIIPYSKIINIHGEDCEKVFEFGTTEDIEKVRKAWEN